MDILPFMVNLSHIIMASYGEEGRKKLSGFFLNALCLPLLYAGTTL